MIKQAIGYPEISFCILEIDWIDFVRHSRTSNFIGNDFLFEIAQRNVLPNISTQISENLNEKNQVSLVLHKERGILIQVTELIRITRWNNEAISS